jgi:putative solute:sodium symporter small subunit
MKEKNVFTTAQQRAAYWRHVKRLTGWLLAIWFGMTFCIIFFARELSGYTMFGWPLSFYMAAQGVVIIYLVLIAFYAWSMRQLDKSVMGKAQHEQ